MQKQRKGSRKGTVLSGGGAFRVAYWGWAMMNDQHHGYALCPVQHPNNYAQKASDGSISSQFSKQGPSFRCDSESLRRSANPAVKIQTLSGDVISLPNAT